MGLKFTVIFETTNSIKKLPKHQMQSLLKGIHIEKTFDIEKNTREMIINYFTLVGQI